MTQQIRINYFEAVGLVAIVVSLAFVAAANGTAQEPSVDDQIMEMYGNRLDNFQSAATAEARADAYVADIVDEAVWMPQGGEPVRGKKAVHEWAVNFFATWILEIDGGEFEPIIVGENFAIRRWVGNGAYEERASGRRIPYSHNYIDILQKQSDGSWKLASHMWNSNNRLPSIWSE